MNRRNLFTDFASNATRPAASPGAKHFTNAVLRTHENKEVKFYDDLIKGKHVVINFMYANCQGACPAITANLLKVQESLKDRVGRDIFMYSITLKPEEDDPEALKMYAEMHGVKKGWTFLTGDPYDLATIRLRLFRESQPGLDLNLSRHTGMLRVINDRINRWSGCSALASRETIQQVISFADEIKPYETRLRQNAVAQAKINQMETLPTWLSSLGND